MVAPAEEQHVADPLGDNCFPPAFIELVVRDHQRALLDRVPVGGEAADPPLVRDIDDLPLNFLQFVRLQFLRSGFFRVPHFREELPLRVGDQRELDDLVVDRPRYLVRNVVAGRGNTAGADLLQEVLADGSDDLPDLQFQLLGGFSSGFRFFLGEPGGTRLRRSILAVDNKLRVGARLRWFLAHVVSNKKGPAHWGLG